MQVQQERRDVHHFLQEKQIADWSIGFKRFSMELDCVF